MVLPFLFRWRNLCRFRLHCTLHLKAFSKHSRWSADPSIMSLAPKPIYASRRVITAPYFVDQYDRLAPRRPSRCVTTDDRGTCLIAFHRWRPRKCGLDYPLACFQCKTHNCSFTVYPPGWLPFGRRSIIPLTPSGFDIHGLGVSEGWQETAFGASIDAGQKQLCPLGAGGAREWEKKYGYLPYGVRRTQARHITGVLRLMALRGDLEDQRPKVAAVLGLNLSAITSCAARPRDGPPLVACGAKGAELLSAVGRPCQRLLASFLRLGKDLQFWGPPIHQH